MPATAEFRLKLQRGVALYHVTFTPIAKHFMPYCRLIYMLSMLYVRLMIKVKVKIPESFKVGWYPHKIQLSRVTLSGFELYSRWVPLIYPTYSALHLSFHFRQEY